MESVLKLFQHAWAKGDKVDTTKQNEEIIQEIKEVSRRLEYNNCWFQLECNENLIDACIYQREELRSRYRYLLNLAKQKGINCSSFQN